MSYLDERANVIPNNPPSWTMVELWERFKDLPESNAFGITMLCVGIIGALSVIIGTTYLLHALPTHVFGTISNQAAIAMIVGGGVAMLGFIVPVKHFIDSRKTREEWRAELPKDLRATPHTISQNDFYAFENERTIVVCYTKKIKAYQKLSPDVYQARLKIVRESLGRV